MYKYTKKYISDTDKLIIKHTITPIEHGLPDPILSQFDVIYVHPQKVKTLAEMEREVCSKQKQKSVSNIHDIYNSDTPKTSEIEVSHIEYCIL